MEKGQNNLSSIKDYFATDYMLGTILFVYCLLFINTFYLSKIDVSRNKNLLNSQKNNTTISKELMNIQSADN
jgi:MFS-type transporter involved in bile tolerance (Atg22 family)